MVRHASRKIAHWIGRNWARLSYSHFVEPIWLETCRLDLPIPNLEPRLRGLRILHLTDFHLCQRVPASLVRQAIDSGVREGCDLIALTGDFVHAGYRFVPAIAQMLSRLHAPLGVYAVLGNHDYSVRSVRGIRRYPRLPDTVTQALTDVGIHVLRNRRLTLDHHGSPIVVAGVADYWSRESNLPEALDGLDSTIPRIVLAHNPCSLEQLGGRRCDLMLSGHTHGGQIDVPGLGRPMLSRKMRNYAAGLIRHDAGYLYVNKGIGYTVRLRYQARPEIAVLRLDAGQPGAL